MVQEAVSGSFDYALQISLAGKVVDALRSGWHIVYRFVTIGFVALP